MVCCQEHIATILKFVCRKIFLRFRCKDSRGIKVTFYFIWEGGKKDKSVEGNAIPLAERDEKSASSNLVSRKMKILSV